MNILPKSVQKLIDEFSKLPGIGPKSAARLAFYLLSKGEVDIQELGKAIYHLKRNLKKCSICFNISETDPCVICQDQRRDKSKIMVLQSSLDILAIEKTGEYHGLYHILGGEISPVDDIGPEDLRIKELLDRVKKDFHNFKRSEKQGSRTIERGPYISEVILATNPSLEGEATAMYISQQIRNTLFEESHKASQSEIRKNLKVTRIARGLPVGSDLEYADEITLSRALEGRREY